MMTFDAFTSTANHLQPVLTKHEVVHVSVVSGQRMSRAGHDKHMHLHILLHRNHPQPALKRASRFTLKGYSG
jgi:hypothetical protein